MITKGRVESIVDASTAKVRVPFIDGYRGLSNSVPSDELNEAKISTAFGICPNLNIGDEVYIAFENGYIDKPIIIGVVAEQGFNPSKRFGDASFDNLTVTGNVSLPANTTLGTMPLFNLMKIIGEGGTLDEMINTANSKFADIYDIISKSPEFEVKAFMGYYDGNAHAPIVEIKSDATTVLYSEDGENYSTYVPTYKIGTHTVYIKASTMAKSVIKETTINIEPYPVSYSLKDSVFKFTGSRIIPEVIFGTVNKSDVISAGSITYIDELGQQLSEISEPGTYTLQVNSLAGKDAEYYTLDTATPQTVIITDTSDYTYEWGGITNTIHLYDGNPHTFTVYKSVRGTNQ